MNFILQALAISLLYKRSVEGATVGVWAYSSSCVGDPYKIYNAYSDMCTARLGVAITLSECSASNVKLILFEDSESEKVNAPKCGTGQGSYIDASKTCTKFSTIGYVKLIEDTCKAPNTVFIANTQLSSCSTESQQKYSTITADGACRSLEERVTGYSYTANLGSSKAVDFKIFKSLTCNQSLIDTSWTGIPTTGVCTDASPPNYFEALSVSVPAPFSFPSITSIIGGVIAGAVIGTLVCCCGCWGVLHACGVVNCPCFNRCCDRRKNIASNSNSYPSPTSYASQAPRSSPYGNTRL